jgi:tyrosyl-tRNA synthetase
MNVDGEIGGNDQTFNMLMGRDLIKTLKNKEKFVVATKLLVDSNGKKMGKTDGNAVSMDQTPEEIYGRVMSWNDDIIVNAFEIATRLPIEEINNIKKMMDSGANPKQYKSLLAKEIISIIHDRDSANRAEKSFDSLFKNKEVPSDILELIVKKEETIKDIIISNNIVSSNTEWRRLINSNAITEFPSEKVINDPYIKLDKDTVLRIGKKRFVKIIIK